MTREPINIRGSEHAGREVEVTRIEVFQIFEVHAADLERIEEAASEERDAMSFLMFLVGVLVTAAFSWVASSKLSIFATCVHIAVIVPLTPLSVWFGLRVRALRKVRARVSARAWSGGRVVPATPPPGRADTRMSG